MRNSILIALFSIFICCQPVYAQYIPFDNYTGANGLPSNLIYDIEQDQQGYLWLATQSGAVKFDGYNFHTYTIENGLPDNNVVDVFIDKKSQKWLATESSGLAIISNNSIRKLNTENGLVSDYALAISEDTYGNIWYLSHEGISLIKPDTTVNFNEYNNEEIGKIISFYVASDGKVWFSIIGSLFYFDNELHRVEDPQFHSVTVHSITEDRPGSLWFATDKKGIIHVTEGDTTIFDRGNFLKSNTSLCVIPAGYDTVIASTSYSTGIYRIVNNRVDKVLECPELDDVINQILYDSRGRIWAKTQRNGIILLEGNVSIHITEKNNLVYNNILRIFEDSNSNIWIATTNGLSKYGKVIFQIFNEGFINNDIVIQSIAESHNTIFLGTTSGLNILWNNKVIRQYDSRNGLPVKPDVPSILPESQDRIWIGTYFGLTLLNNGQTTRIPYTEIFKRAEDEWATDLINLDGIIYCATGQGLIRYDQHKYYQYTIDDGLADNNVWNIASDKYKNIWCATWNGLSIFDGENFHNYGIEEGLPYDYCNDIAFDQEGIAWIATDKGISKVKLNADWSITCINISAHEGLQSDIIFSILADKQGFIWAGHNMGLDRINPNNFNITHYGALEGFLPGETSLGAAITTSGDELWFGTVKGAVKYMPKNDFVYTDAPRIYITGISFYNDTASILKYASGCNSVNQLPIDLILPYNKNNLIFNYIGLHYTIIEKNRYKYILSGYDSDWSEPTGEIKTPPYRKIPPGKYLFKVLAANCDGVWTDTPATFNFEIRPPVWQTWWFHTLEVLAAIALFILILRLRESKLRHDKQVLTQKVKERTLEIEKQRDQIALQKKEITDSIEYAEKIQVAALPKSEFIDNFLSEYFILFKPRDIVSGDFYWINSIENKLVVVAADCTGHGVPGAFMSMLGISILNEIAAQKKRINAGKILDTLREHLTKTLWQTGKEEDAKDGMDVALCIIDPDKSVLQFAGAYNPLILIRGEEILVFKGDKMPVGFHFGEMPPFSTETINYSKGDRIYMYSDGYADQFGGPEDKKFMSVNFRKLLSEVSLLPMEEQKVRLNETIENWKGINEQIDDILVVGIKL